MGPRLKGPEKHGPSQGASVIGAERKGEGHGEPPPVEAGQRSHKDRPVKPLFAKLGAEQEQRDEN